MEIVSLWLDSDRTGTRSSMKFNAQLAKKRLGIKVNEGDVQMLKRIIDS